MSLLSKIKNIILHVFSKSEKKVEYELHKWKKQLIIADKAICVLVILLLGVFRPDALIIGVYLLLYPYLLLTARKTAVYHLFVSSIVALIWMLIANKQYGYNTEMLTIFGLNSFPLFAWASGLFGIYILYSHWEHKFKFTSPIKKMMLFAAFYWPILIAVETIGYHIFNIKNVSAAIYAGLPICDCIHAPLWMQISYLTLGLLFFGICQLIGLDNPHHIKKKS
jgi:hypothetical protein